MSNIRRHVICVYYSFSVHIVIVKHTIYAIQLHISYPNTDLNIHDIIG